MTPIRYEQFCPIARASEILGERWTVLVIKELLIGPRRFSDLRDRLPGISTSVLTDRLQGLEGRGIVRRAELPPPAAATVYQLAEAGYALVPVITALGRWGARWLFPGSDTDFAAADWIPSALAVFARSGATPADTFAVTIRDAECEARCRVIGGASGAVLAPVPDSGDPADVDLAGTPQVIMRLAAGQRSVTASIREDGLRVRGDRAVARRFPEQFDFGLPARSGGSGAFPNPTGD